MACPAFFRWGRYPHSYELCGRTIAPRRGNRNSPRPRRVMRSGSVRQLRRRRRRRCRRKHQGRVCSCRRLALFGRHAGVVRQVAVAGAVDEGAGAHREPARFGLEQERVERLAAARDADCERMEQQLDAGLEQQRVGSALEGGGVVGLGVDPAEDQVRLVQPAEGAHPAQQVVGDAVHHLHDLPVHVGMQAAEVGDAGGRAHAAEKAVALDQQGAGAVSRGRGRRGDAGRAAAEHDHVVLAVHRRRARGLGDRRRRGLGRSIHRREAGRQRVGFWTLSSLPFAGPPP